MLIRAKSPAEIPSEMVEVFAFFVIKRARRNKQQHVDAVSTKQSDREREFAQVTDEIPGNFVSNI